VEKTPAGAFASAEFSGRIARPCRAPCPGNLAWVARGIETRRALVRARVSLRGSFSGFN